MKLKKAKNGRLIFIIGGVIAATVIALSIVQILTVRHIVKKEIQKDSSIQYETICETSASLYESLVDGFISKLNFYTNSDVVMSGGSTEEIVQWFSSDVIVSLRPDVFDYIGYVDATGNNYADTGSTSNVADRDYYREIVNNGNDTYVDNPTIARSTGRNILHICKAVKQYGRTIGLFYAAVDPNVISDMLDAINLGDAGYVVIFGGDGTIIGTSIEDSDFVRELEDAKANYPKAYEKIEQAWITDDEYNADVVLRKGKTLLIADPVDGTDWNIVYFLTESVIFDAADVAAKVLIIGGGILVVAILVIIGCLIFFSMKPLVIVEKTIRGIATGDADLTKRIDINVNNEIGRVVDDFNTFSEKLQTIVATMKDSKNELVDAGQMLSDSTSDTSAAITQIIANIESMGSSINSQSDSVHQTAGAVNEIASNIESLNRMIESQASSVTEASAAVEEMIGNINSVNNSVKKMAIAFEDLEEKTQIGVQKQNDVNSKIAEIETESQALQEANTVISGIAEQTNLLAMNAAIEAAHAGEAGKGFSVVADEIRKLSEDSSSQSQTIGTQLSKIIAVIQEIVDYSQLATDAFNEVSFGINSTNNLVREITNAMEEQNAGSQQISIALHTMNDTSNEVKTSSYEMAEGNKSILQEIKLLQDATFSIKDGMEEMSVGARKINETGAALSELSRKMDSSIKKIGDQVDQFKV